MALLRQRRRIAVVGGGVSGIVSAHRLSHLHSVDLFEAGSWLGGHTHTVPIEQGPDCGAAIDTGFIVFNGDTYPNFLRFLKDLEVDHRRSDMSFGYFDESSRIAYGGHDLDTFFARRSNLANPDFLRMACDIVRFNWQARRSLVQGSIRGTLRDFCRSYSGIFQRHYLLPLGAAIWSAPLQAILDFPAETYLRFFANHGLLKTINRPDWYSVVGGSWSYVEAFRRKFSGRIFLNTAVEQIRRRETGVELAWGGQIANYDEVVVATHADQALRLLADPSPQESAALGAWTYQPNRVILHTDVSLLPPLRRIWSSWNYRRSAHSEGPATLTYDMNRLQGLTTQHHYLVTLNPQHPIDPNTVLGEWTYRHPQYDSKAVASQRLLPALNGVRHTYFCGSYHGYGFHEDAVRSGLGAAEAL